MIKKKSFSLNEEIADKYDLLFQEAQATNPNLTQGEFFNSLLEQSKQTPTTEPKYPNFVLMGIDRLIGLRSSKPDLSDDEFTDLIFSSNVSNEEKINELESEIIELRSQVAIYKESAIKFENQAIDQEESFKETQDTLLSLHRILRVDLSESKETLLQTARLLVENRLQSTEETLEVDNQVIITLPDHIAPLLQETCNRLTRKLKKEVTPADLLLDIFSRYTIEQFNEWFYPFVISGGDFEKICGYTQPQLKGWLKQLDSK